MTANVKQSFSYYKRKRADTASSKEPPATNNKRRCLINSLCPSSQRDSEVITTVDARYDVQLQSVISSSKIQKRVSAMIRHLTPPMSPSSTKGKVSVLRAKACDVGKLVSIAEIAKREIEKEVRTCTTKEEERTEEAGSWFQYIALGEDIQPRNPDEGNSIVRDTVLRHLDVGEGPDDGSEGVEFQFMETPSKRAIEGQPLLRGTPVMSLFLSRSPIEELRQRYGEQTNT